jgi:uncharacterized membrane protein
LPGLQNIDQKEKGPSMKLEFRRNQDFWAGLMFLGIGAVAIFIARNYPFGRLLRMGAGYFPTLLGGVLILFGAYIMVKGLLKSEKVQGSWSIRAMIVLPVMIILFGLLMERAGFIPALAVLTFGSAAASKEFRWGEVLLLTAFLTALSLAVFIWGLGLPYPLFKGF